ncbi:hypothetical protein L1887_23121 [Cichorium endivia]|nr:hypothetical protein L1887_23121 [Cichorium endivia]
MQGGTFLGDLERRFSSDRHHQASSAGKRGSPIWDTTLIGAHYAIHRPHRRRLRRRNEKAVIESSSNRVNSGSNLSPPAFFPPIGTTKHPSPVRGGAPSWRQPSSEPHQVDFVTKHRQQLIDVGAMMAEAKAEVEPPPLKI